MLKIRLIRVGRRNDPHYRMVVSEASHSLRGKYTAALGNYNPRSGDLKLDTEAIMRWLNQGAQPSNRVARILSAQKITHKLIKVKKYRAISKAELENQKKIEEEQKAKEQAQKAAREAEAREKLKAIEEKKHQEAAAAAPVESEEKPAETKTESSQETAPSQPIKPEDKGKGE